MALTLMKRLLRVFPAYAGVIPYLAHEALGLVRVPRVCGGDPIADRL